ncbi:MAG: hypothetical protein ACJA0S_000661 [Rickettsiales bacterium]
MEEIDNAKWHKNQKTMIEDKMNKISFLSFFVTIIVRFLWIRKGGFDWEWLNAWRF